jgi:NADPH:quinone reductase-like Zn-dependent oxidoreductase
MRAVLLHEAKGIDCLRVEEVSDPRPGAGEVRVALAAAALNHRDVFICDGLYPGMTLPCILGSDGAGTIDAVGRGVDAALIGQEVVIYPALEWGSDLKYPSKNFRVRGMPDQGTFAEYLCVAAGDVRPRPPSYDWTQAAAIPLAGLTSWRAVVTHAQVAAREKVLVTGIGGGVATLALRWAVALGADVYVTSGSEEKIARAKSMGAAGGVSYREDDWDKRLREMCGGVDVIIDGTGGDTFSRCFNVLNGGGRFVLYGATLGNPPKPFEMARFFFRQARLQGTTMGTPGEFRAMLEFADERGIEPVVDRVFALEEAVAAHQYMARAAQMGKIVLRIR